MSLRLALTEPTQFSDFTKIKNPLCIDNFRLLDSSLGLCIKLHEYAVEAKYGGSTGLFHAFMRKIDTSIFLYFLVWPQILQEGGAMQW